MTHVPMNPREGAITAGEPASTLSPAGKVAVIRDYLERYDCRTLIETGLYGGHGSGMHCLDLVDRYIAIDYQEENCTAARAAGAEAYCGDSGIVLRNLLGYPAGLGVAPVEAPALFWLDAHAISDDEGAPPCPLLRELEAIGLENVVLIDDVRLFGMGDWPTLEQVTESLPAGNLVVLHDIMRLTP